VGSKVIGILSVYGYQPDLFGAEEIALFDQLGKEMSLAYTVEAERKLVEIANSQLRHIANNLPVLIAYLNAERKFQFINKTGERWCAREAKDIIGKSSAEIRGLVSVYDGDELFKAFKLGHLEIERTNTYPDGITRSVQSTLVPDKDSDGNIRGYFRLDTDVTTRNQVQSQLRDLQKREAIGQLTGGVAHDFNNLLMIIGGNLAIAAGEVADRPDTVAHLDTARKAVDRGASLTRSLLAFSRQQSLQPKVVDVQVLFHDLESLIRRTLPESIELKFIAEEDLWPCEVDPGQLQNALLNLIVNARDAMPDGGKLTIEVSNAVFDAQNHHPVDGAPYGSYVELAVTDTGHGMTEEVLAKAFDPFFTTKDVGKGSGLGLSMVYGFVTQSKGAVKIDSTVGVGTTVRIYLPKVGQVTEGAEAAATPVAHHPLRGKTVLVVEDDADVRALTVSMLRSVGLTVLEADRVETALHVAQTPPKIDLLLSDVILPGGKSGRVIAEELQRQVPNLKVLYMSGYTEDVFADKLDAGDGAKVHLLHKPFKKDDLLAKVSEILAT
jgi:signal transduction histidine kinase